MEKRKKKYSTGTIIRMVILYGILALIAILCVLPVIHVLMASLSNPMKFVSYKGFLFWPVDGDFSVQAYEMLFRNEYFWRSYLNTILYTSASVILGLVISIMASYALCRKGMLFKRPILFFILVTMFFNGGMVPFYIVVHGLGLVNTPWAMILPTCCNALNIVMLRTGMMAIPDSIREAAEIDGAGPVRVMVQIIVPLCVPFIVVVALFNFVAQWNSWANASLFLTAEHQELYPLQLIMRDILLYDNRSGISTGSWLPISVFLPGIRMAAVVIASLPLIIAYPFLQKHFEKGMVIGGVKE